MKAATTELQLGEAGALQDWRVNTLEGGVAHPGGYTDREQENHFRAQDDLGSQPWAHSSLVLRVPVESEEPVSLSDEKTRDEVVPVVVTEPLNHPAQRSPVSQISGSDVYWCKDTTGKKGVQFINMWRLQTVSVSLEYL